LKLEIEWEIEYITAGADDHFTYLDHSALAIISPHGKIFTEISHF